MNTFLLSARRGKGHSSLARLHPIISSISASRGRASGRGISTQELDDSKGERERIVILGSGWSGFTLSRQLNPKKYQTVVVSPRSYFVFTPLLASTAVGTLEFRNVLESVRGGGGLWKGRGWLGGLSKWFGGRNVRGVNGENATDKVQFYQGWADDVDFERKVITVEENAGEKAEERTVVEGNGKVNQNVNENRKMKQKGKMFDLGYDKLVVAVGCYSQTFGTKGVKENALFLKDIKDARKIRMRVLECFETAALPTTPESLKKHLLNFAIVGGGPTGVEFAAELHDLAYEDLSKIYPDLLPYVKITIFDVAPKILPMFDKGLADYALRKFRRDGIEVRTEMKVEELRRGLPSGDVAMAKKEDVEGKKDIGKVGEKEDDAGCFTLRTKQDGEMGVGMCVWSTGLGMNPFVERALSDVRMFPSKSAVLAEASASASSIEENGETGKGNAEERKWKLKRDERTGGLMVDDRFRVKIVTSSSPTPSSPNQISQQKGSGKESEAEKEATVLDVFAIGDVAVMEKAPLPATAQVANQEAKWLGKRLNAGAENEGAGFTFRNLGVITYLGGWKAIMQMDGKEVRGRTAWLIWRGAYLTQTISYRNKLLIPMYWAINWLFGRDISRF